MQSSWWSRRNSESTIYHISLLDWLSQPEREQKERGYSMKTMKIHLDRFLICQRMRLLMSLATGKLSPLSWKGIWAYNKPLDGFRENVESIYPKWVEALPTKPMTYRKPRISDLSLQRHATLSKTIEAKIQWETIFGKSNSAARNRSLSFATTKESMNLHSGLFVILLTTILTQTTYDGDYSRQPNSTLFSSIWSLKGRTMESSSCCPLSLASRVLWNNI